MAIFQQGQVPPEQKSIFPEGAEVHRIITHDMGVVDGTLYVNGDDSEDFRTKFLPEKRAEHEAAQAQDQTL